MPRMWQKAHYELSLDWQGHATEILSKLPRQHVEAIPPSVGNATSCLFQAVFNLKLSVEKGDIYEQG